VIGDLQDCLYIVVEVEWVEAGWWFLEIVWGYVGFGWGFSS
jgi:hypothetical protein